MPADDPEDDNPLREWNHAEERWGSPETDLPSIPEAPEVDTTSVDPLTARYFWGAVFLANLALAGVSIGLMLVVFRGEWAVGGAAILVGLLAGAHTYRVYRQFMAETADDGAPDPADAPVDAADSAAGADET